MNEFLIVIHRDITSKNASPSPEQMKEAMKPYQEWIASIAAEDRLVAPPKRWDVDGRVISTAKKVHEGPYAEGKVSLGGLFLIRAKDYDEAVSIAHGARSSGTGPLSRYVWQFPPHNVSVCLNAFGPDKGIPFRSRNIICS